ncbi:uncharacterized protein pnhd [Ictalurus punctatus]|uniref:Uncharacterized protein pnhd n=1 Tax=Ictalurus punctatus TaxID=7998 RepID=A0A2D0T6T4_ICTPU|nr:uncharacterized protein pnhd [Ictalurus punctatus]
MDRVLLYEFLLLSFCHQSLTAVLNMHIDPRNLFAERACCRRQSHFIYVGQDILGSPVNVDVGMCRTNCGQAQPSSFEAGMQGYSSMLDFLRDKKVLNTRTPAASSLELTGFGGNLPSCGASMTCEPTGLRVDKVMLIDGLREVELIEDCHCEAKVTRCVRAPSLRTYFYETPYETVIDVGKCVGSKVEPEGFSCVPTKFDSALVDTPNKVELIQTVVGCDMKEGCYRIPYVEYHYEITYNEDGLKEEKLKEIDVGRCLGSCTSGNSCLLRSASDSAECLLWAEGQGSACVPQGYESHTFLNHHGQIRTVLAITSCLCQS